MIDVEQFGVVGVKVRADGGVDARWALAVFASPFVASAHAIHIG